MKTGQLAISVAALSFLGACTTSTRFADFDGEPAHLEEVPEEIIAMAAPNQNLQAVRIEPADGCYWYQWAGPVETTYLPLVTSDGRRICTSS